MQQQQEKHFQWQQRTFYKLKDALQIIKGTSTTETLWKKKQINKTAWNKQRVDGGKRKKKGRYGATAQRYQQGIDIFQCPRVYCAKEK